MKQPVISNQCSVISNQYSVISKQRAIIGGSRTTQQSPRFTFHVSRITHHVSRFTFHVSGSSVSAFTLVELLVVIAIISLLAALIIPITGAVKRNEIRSKARSELTQVQSAIENYKTKLGHYPPDNPGKPSTNQLLYELLGTTNNNGTFWTIEGSAKLRQSDFNTAYGPNVAGFANTSQGSSDEGRTGAQFLSGLKAPQIGQPFTNTDAKYLVCSIPWDRVGENWLLGVPNMNPFCYVSSNPTNNPGSYDLWVDVLVGGKTNRICNWSRDYTVVGPPWP